MQIKVSALLALIPLASLSAASITYDNLPLGTEEKPLVFRTYMPDPGLDAAYFSHHGTGAKSPKYSPGDGKDKKGYDTPVKGFPAAIGVNHGPALSYAFDTVECRIAYVWKGGFLDMYPYWGNPDRGNRLSNNYVPHLVGILFHKADPMSEIYVEGKRMTDLEDPHYIGYDLVAGNPVFKFSRGGKTFDLTISPVAEPPLSFSFTIASPDAKTISYGSPEGKGNTLTRTVTGSKLATYQGFPRNMKIKKATIANGQLLYDSLGCSACHSIDGSLGHGPTLAGLFGSERLVEESREPVKADRDYLMEAIKAPSAKTAKGFPPNYMPPYILKDLEYESLLLFIESVAKGE